jgi:hypothetical protein
VHVDKIQEDTRVSGLSKQQIDFFQAEGYHVLHELLRQDDLQPAIDDINRAIDEKSAEMVEAGILSQSYSDLDFEHRLAAISRETDQVALSLWNGVLHGPGFFALIANPKLLDVAE